jgi:hypothetical protein
MKLLGLSLAVIAVLLVALAPAAAPKAEDKAPGVFAPLEKGSKVALKEVAGRYEINMIPGGAGSHTVAEIAGDLVVLVDPSGVTETRIPVYSIKAVTVTRLPKK